MLIKLNAGLHIVKATFPCRTLLITINIPQLLTPMVVRAAESLLGKLAWTMDISLDSRHRYLFYHYRSLGAEMLNDCVE